MPVTNDDDYLPQTTTMVQGVDSEDVEEDIKNSGSLWQQLFHRMHPNQCLMPAVESISTMTYKSCLADTTEEFAWRLPTVLNEIKTGGKPRTPALLKLYRLVDRDHKENRTVALSTDTTIPTLLMCLKLDNNPNERRTALLILNNLCIPNENKAKILFGGYFPNLMTVLLKLIQARTPNAYLAIVSLVNLSSIVDPASKRLIFTFVPNTDSPKETYQLKSALDEPNSCIRILESILRDTIQYKNTNGTVEQHECRWAMNVIRNLLSSTEENALEVAKHTNIVEYAVTCLQQQHNNYAKWTRDSLPDASLMVLVHLGKDDDCVECMRKNQYLADQIIKLCNELMSGAPGIQATRASALKERMLDGSMDRSVGYSV